MSTTLPRPTMPELHHTIEHAARRRSGRPTWPIFGIVAGATGWASAALALTSVTEEQAQEGVGVIDHLSRGNYYASFLLGIVAFASLFVAASGWKRWAEQRAPRDLAARTIGTALAATATINVIFACLAGSMALYLPGGTDEGTLSRESLHVNYTLLDFGQLLGWWGAVVAALCAASLGLRRNRVLPRWMGVVSLILPLPGIAMAAAASLPGFVGLTMPIWLIVISVGLVFSRTAEA
jgi:uncharacterized protein DUF4153